MRHVRHHISVATKQSGQPETAREPEMQELRELAASLAAEARDIRQLLDSGRIFVANNGVQPRRNLPPPSGQSILQTLQASVKPFASPPS